MSKDFSIILPTRERPELLYRLLRSIEKTTFDIENIEILLAIDEDDTTDYVGLHKYFVKTFRVKRSTNFSKDYYTYLYKQSHGKWIIACNDDAEFTTPYWDLESKRVLEGYVKGGPNVVYGWIEDGLGVSRMTQFGNYCCFPLLGRDGIDALGYYFADTVPIWGADIWVGKLYRSICRAVDLPFTIKHISHHNGLREQDELNKRLARINASIQGDMQPTYRERNLLIAKILGKEYIDEPEPKVAKKVLPRLVSAFR